MLPIAPMAPRQSQLRKLWPPVVVAALCLGGAAALFTGCGPDCGEAQTIRYEHGITDEAGTTYQSTPITGPLLHFPPRRKYQLVHGLRGVPSDVHVSLSFQETAGPDASLSLAASAGNQALYSVEPDKGTITVTNDVCGEFYVYVTARSAPDGG